MGVDKKNNENREGFFLKWVTIERNDRTTRSRIMSNKRVGVYSSLKCSSSKS